MAISRHTISAGACGYRPWIGRLSGGCVHGWWVEYKMMGGI